MYVLLLSSFFSGFNVTVLPHKIMWLPLITLEAHIGASGGCFIPFKPDSLKILKI